MDRKSGGDGRVVLRRLGWTVLAVGVAATAVLVPPLVVPSPPPAPTTSPPQAAAPPSAAPPSAATPPSTVTSSVVITRVVVPPPVVTPSEAAPPPPVGATSSRPAAFPSITVHAADPANLRSGARVIECASCRGGSRVGYIGGPNVLAVRVAGVPAAGTRTLTIVYETEEPRTLMVAVNDGTAQSRRLTGAASLLIPATTSVEVFVPAGDSWIRFFNDTGSAPDVNEIVLS